MDSRDHEWVAAIDGLRNAREARLDRPDPAHARSLRRPLTSALREAVPVALSIPNQLRSNQAASPALLSETVGAEDLVDRQDQDLLRLHSRELIAELRRWSRDLEARETHLNTRDALLDQRVRQFRTWEASQKQEIVETRRLVARLERETRDRLRRVAAAELF